MENISYLHEKVFVCFTVCQEEVIGWYSVKSFLYFQHNSLFCIYVPRTITTRRELLNTITSLITLSFAVSKRLIYSGGIDFLLIFKRSTRLISFSI